MDATCAPADIRYPTDVSLLNEARDKTDAIIDVLHAPLVGKSHHSRTYRPPTYRKQGGSRFLGVYSQEETTSHRDSQAARLPASQLESHR